MAPGSNVEAPSWQTMFRTALQHPKNVTDNESPMEYSSTISTPTRRGPETQSKFSSSHLSASVTSANCQLAFFIALAHGGLICCGAMLVGLFLLLKGFWEPILWAILCSMPLRKVQDSMVAFWEPSLKAGFFPTILAPFRAMLQAVAGTLYDANAFVLGTLGVKVTKREKTGFERLSQWLTTFALFNLAVDYCGFLEALLAAPLGVLLYRHFSADKKPRALKYRKKSPSEEADGEEKSTEGIQKRSRLISVLLGPFRAIDRYLCTSFLNGLRTRIALSIILILCVGSLFTAVFFTFQIAMEGKDAVVALDQHMRSSNYLERIGVSGWLEKNNVSALINTYSATALQTISEQIDVYSAKYDMVEAGDAMKTYLKQVGRGGRSATFSGNSSLSTSGLSSLMEAPEVSPFIQTANSVKMKALSYDFKGALHELQEGTFATLERYNISREGATLKVTALLNSTGKYMESFVSSGSSLLTKTASASGAVFQSVSEGAKDMAEFLASTVFFVSLLYYFMTSEAGGVLQQALDLFPFSSKAKLKFETVIGDAISGVLLSVVEVALFEAIFTFLLLWFFNVHFLYFSTTIAVFNSAFPILPSWLCLLPGALQLVLETRYIEIVPMILLHQVGLSYAKVEIMKEIPGHSPYLIGLSIAGSTALFNSVFKGAIFGPLMVAIIIALRNLHSEFLTSIMAD